MTHWNTLSSFAYPLGPVNPPMTKMKCDRQSAVMNAMTEASGNVPGSFFGVTASELFSLDLGRDRAGWETGAMNTVSEPGGGVGAEEVVGEVGSPSTGRPEAEGDEAGGEDGARSVVNSPVFSSKATLASSSIMAVHLS